MNFLLLHSCEIVNLFNLNHTVHSIYLRNEFDFWNVHGIMNTLGLMQSKWSPKASLTLHEAFAWGLTFQKLNLLLIFTFYYKYLKYRNYLECKTEKRTSQSEHRQPMEQTRSLFCMCDSGVAGCQSQHQCHFWWMNSMFKAYCKWAWQLPNQIYFLVLWDHGFHCGTLKLLEGHWWSLNGRN